MCEPDKTPDPPDDDDDDDDDPLVDALQLAEETEAVAALLVCFAEQRPAPHVRSAAKALQRSARELILLIGEIIEHRD